MVGHPRLPHSPECTTTPDENQMTSIAINPLRCLACALALVVGAAQSPPAQEQVFGKYNCAITPPDDWQAVVDLPPQAGLFGGFANSDRTRLLTLKLIQDQKKRSGPMDDRFVSEFEEGYEASGGGKPVSRRFIEVSGIKGYERVGDSVINGQRVSIVTRVVPSKRSFYIIQAMRFDGDATEEPALGKALASFRFLKAPVPVAESDSGSAAYRIGVLTGRVIGFLLVVGILIAIIANVFRKRKGVRRSKLPPPLPQ